MMTTDTTTPKSGTSVGSEKNPPEKIMTSGSLSESPADTTPPSEPPISSSAKTTTVSLKMTGNKCLSKLLCLGGFNNNNKTKTPTPTPRLMEDVDHVLESTTASAEEARNVLRGMVSDLLCENDGLTLQLKTTQEKLHSSEQAHDLIRLEYMEKITELIQTVERAMDQHPRQQTDAFAIAIAAHASTSGGTSFSISPQEATEMIVQSLSRKVEHLHLEKSVLEQDLIATRESMEDLESLNQARLYTIDALEAQFRTKQARPRRTVSSPEKYYDHERKSPVSIVRATSSPPYHHKNPTHIVRDNDDEFLGYTPLMDSLDCAYNENLVHIVEIGSEMGEI
jgi:hypothetical protein